MRTNYQSGGIEPYISEITPKGPEMASFTEKNAYNYDKSGSNLPEKRTMNNNLANVKRTLHDLFKSLPAVKTHCSEEVHKRHLALIAHYQRRYDLLAAAK